MKTILYLILGISFLLGCTPFQKSISQQGIKGKIVWFEGNLMPTIDSKTSNNKTLGIPIQRTIWIYNAVTRSDTNTGHSSSFYSEVHGKLIKKIKTDKKGFFKANLEPGKYSIFVQEEAGLFANVFDGEGFINPITVEAGKFTDVVIKVNYKAAY
jgi:hypothetical protein